MPFHAYAVGDDLHPHVDPLPFLQLQLEGLLFNPERIEFAGGGDVSRGAPRRQKAILALLQRWKLDPEDTWGDLFGIVFFGILLRTLGGMKDAAGPGAEFPPVSLHIQPQQLILGDRRAFSAANNEFRVTANL